MWEFILKRIARFFGKAIDASGGEAGEAGWKQFVGLFEPLAPADLELPKDIAIVPKGLRAFDEEDASFYLYLLPGPRRNDGLPESIHFWKTRIEETNADKTFRVGLIYGPSGCGKSSLVKAGLIPHLSDQVTHVYVEATASDTEDRLLAALKQHCPYLSPKTSLRAALHRKDRIPDGRKVLIVLDQFEQYLHATSFDEQESLVDALRECDGERLQCVVMVRDDFITPVNRFINALDIELSQNKNYALFDLFDKRHAKKVLAMFGQASDALPKSGKLTKKHDTFLNRAVSELLQDDYVICVRLVLFAEMVKAKDWLPATLKSVGGAEGVGKAFLEENLSAKTAPLEVRHHVKAAEKVLAALLPESGTGIKGAMKSKRQLLDASDYARRPEDFEELLAILDTKLRLITPAEAVVAAEDGQVSAAAASDKYYQLTHDYLVPSLREWLSQEREKTRYGRAERRLEKRAALWSSFQERRHLPAWWEHGNIRLFTKKGDWTKPQRAMLRAAAKYHMIRGVVLVIALIAVVCFFCVRLGNQRAKNLVNDVKSAPSAEAASQEIRRLSPYRRWAIPILEKGIDQPAPSREPSDPLTWEVLNSFEQRARIAAALLYLDHANKVWPLLQHSPDPTEQTHLIHRLGDLEADPIKLFERLEEEGDDSIRMALILSLGESPVDDKTKKEMISKFKKLYHNDPNSGVHGATGWLLRHWNQETEVKKIENQLQGKKPTRSGQWYINAEGHTMVMLGPVEGFWMGSPEAESERISDERLHKRRIGRRFAIANTEVTAQQFQRFLTEKREELETSMNVDESFRPTVKDIPLKADTGIDPGDADLPVEVNWYAAAAYCNWLSEQEGIPPSQWCFPQAKASDFRTGMTLHPEYLKRTGYRLPTEAEWEYACRSGARTSYCYGEGKELLHHYSRCSGVGSLSVGSLKPNAFGLFDMHGNLHEWCQGRYEEYPVEDGEDARTVNDMDEASSVTDDDKRVIRGGAFNPYNLRYVRSAIRDGRLPSLRGINVGFRPARTVP